MASDASSRPRTDTSARPALAGLSLEELRALFVAWGDPPYRATQVYDAVQRQGLLDPEAMTTLPKALRRRLGEETTTAATRLEEVNASADGTTKLLLALTDGRRVETVIIPEGDRRTVCVSTQVGCPIGCVFCASGVGGLVRNLETAEIVEQLLRAMAHIEARPSHVVVMGMGEPLLNLRKLAPAIRIWKSKEGLDLSPRRITVSTASTGSLVDRLLEEDLGVELAVSLHAADDETRARLIPTSKGGRVKELVDAAARYARHSRRDATVEYVLIRGENDSLEQADALAALVGRRHVHVNLIPLNPVDHRPDLEAPGGREAKAFARRLEQAGVSVTLRSKRGEDIEAACGQLALKRALGEEA